jgi:EAL domain-containing protein (putative c-di-GMP-specific phosphodiesterase class I)
MRKDNRTCATIKANIEALTAAGHKILFEGIEDELDEITCRDLGVEYFQGFKYSKPVDLEELKTFFDKK